MKIYFRFSLIILVFALAISVYGQEQYLPQVVLESGWGSEPGQFGLQSGEELETVGPRTFTVDNRGNIYLDDFINQRIQQFDSSGKFIKTIGTGLVGGSFCIDDFGNIELLDSYNKIVKCYSEKGEVIKEIKIADGIQLIEGYAQQVFIDAEKNLVVNRIDQQVHPIALLSNAGLINQSFTDQVKNGKMGYLGKTDKNRYRMQWINKHQADIIISDGAPNHAVGIIPIKTNDEFGAVLFLGQDTAGNIYTEIERTDTKDILHLEVWKYNRERKLATVLEVPNDYYSTVYKKLEVDGAGNIFQMQITQKGVRIIKYSN